MAFSGSDPDVPFGDELKRTTATRRPDADVEPASPRLEEIVAYLDGELSADDAASVERRLAADEGYREELQSVERAWDALGELPQATVDDRFSRTTMEMAVTAARDELEAKTLLIPTLKRRRNATSLAMLAVAAVFGWGGLRLWLGDPNADLLADLPVIYQVDIYSQLRNVDEVEFLRKLAQRAGTVLADATIVPAAQEESSEVESDPSTTTPVASLAALDPPPDDPRLRGTWLDALDRDQLTSLRAKYNRFVDLSPDEKTRMRTLHQRIAEADDSDALKETLWEFQQLLVGVEPAHQFELRQLPLEQRVEAIALWVERQQEEAPLQLTDDQLREVAQKLRAVLIENGPPVRGGSRFIPHNGVRRPRPQLMEVVDVENP
ncbi:MAG: hypothetical protein KDA61_08285, partial [Planctomycetales bacterium]|nr:hypothetical protein [Planctomycetales bacterium]